MSYAKMVSRAVMQRLDASFMTAETATTLLNQGNCLKRAGRLLEAAGAYRQAIALNPNFFWLYQNLGEVLAELGDWNGVVDSARRALQLNPDSAWSYSNLGEALSQQGQAEGAIAAYQVAVMLKPASSQFHCCLGNALIRGGRVDEAIDYLRRAVELDPESSKAYCSLGEALLRQGCSEAVNEFQKAIDLNPGCWEAYVYLGNLQAQQQQWETAIEHYQCALAIHSTSAIVFCYLGNALARQQQWEAAIEHYRHVLNLELASIRHPGISLLHSHLLHSYVQGLDESIPRLIKTIYFTEDTLLLKIAGDLEINQDSRVWVNGHSVDSVWVGRSSTNTFADHHPEYCIIISHPHLADQSVLSGLVIFQKDLSTWYFHPDDIHPRCPVQVNQFLQEIGSHEERFIFSLITKVAATNSKLVLSGQYQEFYQQQERFSKQHHLILKYGCWLTPNVLFLEGKTQNSDITLASEIMVRSKSTCEVSLVRFCHVAHQQFIAVVMCSRSVYTADYEIFNLTVISDGNLLPVEGEVTAKGYGLELIDRLNKKPEQQRYLIREHLNRTIIELVSADLRSQVQDLLRKLQCFVQISPTSFDDPSLPVQLTFDYVIPIQADGVLVSGWLLNSHDLIETIEIISDLGFSLSIQEKMYWFDRPDVNQHLRDTPYEKIEDKLGFCAYIQIPESIRAAFADIAELHSFRFQIKLKGEIELSIVPQVQYFDAFTARNLIIKQLNLPQRISDEMLENCIGLAAAKLHQLCMKQVAVQNVIQFGEPVANPLASIIIPLYKQLDFMKVQIATMANDAAIHQCEIIYVLDSPEQADEVRSFFSDHCILYQLPVTLVVMARNSGYAAANNAGAADARGRYIVLMNSDVFPKTKGWVAKMAQFYAASPNIGTLAPKLIYEDRSIQHAGMFFEKTQFPFWINLHYYKGFPSHYSSAQMNRSVPAVSGACLMISRELFERVDRLSTEYMIGDFEDSDLCLKCAELGYENWYFAEAELYHLERQSVSLHDSYSDGLAWRYNAMLHDRKWNTLIEKLMQIYDF
ncbi:MAG: tetratricopeptide repeat protein [Cyanobacteria bacterium CRU_2_1]|nr:tetratricopeptide repeat protein [Cyanobacteria bacterium RU_5_0]NJR60067.1 tetratricopeptide repeat protein [Cyanobacteria bacterium CRU_2_1]